MAKDRVKLIEFQAGNGSGLYRGVFYQNGENDFLLEIDEIQLGEVQTESTKKEAQKVERLFIRPVFDGLDPAEITQRQKQIDGFIKKNQITLEEALVVDKKSKKSLIESGVKFPCEKVYIEETILVDVPVIKTEQSVKYKNLKKLPFYTKVSNRDLRKTLTNFIQTL